jgi:hypothetical protein
MPFRSFLLLSAACVAIQIGVLHWLGQPLICRCGYVKPWEGVVLSSGTSQHLTDWYSFTHINHGVMFYLLTWLALPRLPAPQRFLIALSAEAGWEILENTPYVISVYRQQALAQGYVGDSIINSVSDVAMMSLGFFLSWRLPVLAIAAVAIGLELFVGLSIRDNLTLNLLNFIHEFEFVKRWQSGAG